MTKDSLVEYNEPVRVIPNDEKISGWFRKTFLLFYILSRKIGKISAHDEQGGAAVVIDTTAAWD